jgi:hypothetical protein
MKKQLQESKRKLQYRALNPGPNFIPYLWFDSVTQKIHLCFEHFPTFIHHGPDLIEHPIIFAFPNARG